MTITSTRVATFSFIHNSCDLRSMSCMGNGKHLLRMDDNPPSDPGFFTQRYALSTDDGHTWSEQPEERSTFLPLGPMLSLGLDTMLGGFGAGHPGDPYSPFALISRTTDGGVTWTSALSAALYGGLDPDNADVFAFVTLGGLPQTVLAFGGVSTLGGDRYHVLRSTDGGETFSLFAQIGDLPPSPLSLVDVACYVGGSVVLAAGDFLGGAFPDVSIWRSTNGGASWSEVALPSPEGVGSVACFASMGGGVVLAGGQVETLADSNHVEAVVWRSTDSGLSWTPVVMPGMVFSGGGLQQYTVTWLQPLTSSKVVAGVTIFGPPATVKHWRLSEDRGVSFTDVGTETSTLIGGAGAVRQMTVADDGAVLTAITRFDAPHFAEIWRSPVDGFTGPGPCATTTPVPTPPGSTTPCGSPFRPREGACIDELTDDDIIRGSWQAGDRLIINRVIFSIDWDYVTQQFTKHVIYTFDDSVAKYGLRPAMRIESKGIRSTPTACGAAGVVGCGISQLDERAYNLGARYADPPPMLNIEIFYRKHTWEPGDIICVTSAFVPNVVSGVRGITDEAFEIINIQQQFAPEGKIILTLLDVEAITLPVPPSRTEPGEEQELLKRERPRNLEQVQVPRRVAEGQHLRGEVARWQRGPQQEPPPIIPRPAPRREVLAGSGGRGLAPTVP